MVSVMRGWSKVRLPGKTVEERTLRKVWVGSQPVNGCHFVSVEPQGLDAPSTPAPFPAPGIPARFTPLIRQNLDKNRQLVLKMSLTY